MTGTTAAVSVFCVDCRANGLNVLLGKYKGATFEVKVDGRTYVFPNERGGVAECHHGHMTLLQGVDRSV